MSSQSSNDRDRQSRASIWDLDGSFVAGDDNRLHPNAPRFQDAQFRPALQLQASQQQSAFGQTEDYSPIQRRMHSPHIRLENYETRQALNQFQVPMPQSNRGPGGLNIQPISYPYSQQFHSSLQAQNEMPSYTHATCEPNAASPWSQSISSHSNVLSSPSSHRSGTPHQTQRWGSWSPPTIVNPFRPQSVVPQETHPQLPHSLLPVISSLSSETTRKGTILCNPRPPSRSHSSFPKGELARSPIHAVLVEQTGSGDSSPIPFIAKAPIPLPQNLRGDPFRSAKVKTELCRYHNTTKGCVFGDKCNYAHGEHELKFNKLMDLEREKLVDVEVFRTHPCFSWITTGACPFDQRCIRLHDPRINGVQPSWLPHAEVMITNVGRGLNVDKMHHQQFCSVYSCSPVYGFAPKNRWQSDDSSTRDAWHEFYSFCCSKDSLSSDNELWPVHKEKKELANPFPLIPRRIIPEISEVHRIEMALKMRERRKAQYFTFLPSHLFCGELCMVLQTSYFRLELIEPYQDIKRYEVIEISQEEASNSSSSENPSIITAREITFGPVADANVRPVSVWFNIPEEDITICTRQQARRHKRSRHRLREKRDHQNQPEDMKIAASCSIPPFNCCQPVDDAAFNLITNIMNHRIHVLKYFSSSLNDQAYGDLASEEEVLLKSFESQRRFWVTWTWPKRTGSNYVDDNTDVPDIDGTYSFVTYGNEAYGEDAIFFGVDQPLSTRGQHPVISKEAKLATGLVWKSFIMNLQLISDRGAVEIPTGEERMPDHDPIVSQMRRIQTLRNLSLGRPAMRNSSRSLSSLNPDYCSFTDASTSLDGVFREWTALQHEYDENSSNPLKEAQMDKDKPLDPDHKRTLSYQYDKAAKQWTRSMPDYSD